MRVLFDFDTVKHLKYMNTECKDDYEIVLMAVIYKSTSLEFASDRLQGNELLFRIFGMNRGRFNKLCYSAKIPPINVLTMIHVEGCNEIPQLIRGDYEVNDVKDSCYIKLHFKYGF